MSQVLQPVNIVCELHKDENSPEKFAHLIKETMHIQHGVWNKNILRWRLLNGTNDIKKERDLRYAINIAFTEWDIEIPIVFVEAEPEEEADITIDFRFRANDPYYKDSTTVLAYAGYPEGILKGVLVIFDDWDWNLHGLAGFNVIIVIIHELGHILGFPHYGRGIMAPIYNRVVRELQQEDLQMAYEAYGERQYANTEQKKRLETANHRQKIRLIEAEIPDR